MARTRKTSREVLDEKIEKAEADVIAAKKRYDHATAVLKELLDSGIYVKAAESIDEILPPMDFSHMMVIINGSLYRDERVVKSMVNDKFSACVCKGTQICMITGKPAKFPDTGIKDFFEIPDFQMEKILLGIFKSKMNILFNQ